MIHEGLQGPPEEGSSEISFSFLSFRTMGRMGEDPEVRVTGRKGPPSIRTTGQVWGLVRLVLETPTPSP